MHHDTHRRTLRLGARLWGVAAGIAILAGCGAIALTGGAQGAARFATTPESPGAIDQRAGPLGDGYLSTAPKVGNVFSCQTRFAGNQGAQVAGPWIDTAAGTWDDTHKLVVNGSVSWSGASYRVRVAGSTRTITFNDLPTDHTTGVFPIAQDDPAYRYDRNPNHIAAQSFSWRLPADPTAAGRPTCLGLGPVGVLTDGVALYNALDAQGRDAGAHEVLDRCAGHPDRSSTYHHHAVPRCLLSRARKGHATLIGYALDGYGIYVVKDKQGTLPTNTQLDACHGTTSRVRFDGKVQRIYHYVATIEYPDTVGCYHGTPTSNARARPA